MKYLWIALLLVAFADEGDYKKLKADCQSCNAIDALVTKHNTELSPDNRLDLALKIAKLIAKISVKNKPPLEQKREIYYAMNASVLVLDDDFDSETVVKLMDVRVQAPKSFDYVFWRFPLADQKRLADRMQAFKADKIRPAAEIPKPKAVEP